MIMGASRPSSCRPSRAVTKFSITSTPALAAPLLLTLLPPLLLLLALLLLLLPALPLPPPLPPLLLPLLPDAVRITKDCSSPVRAAGSQTDNPACWHSCPSSCSSWLARAGCRQRRRGRGPLVRNRKDVPCTSTR